MLLQKAVTAAKDNPAKKYIGVLCSCVLPTSNAEISM